MSAGKTPIFITGATGYIGGSVLVRLLEHPNAKNFDITAIVRNPEKAKKLESFGVHAIVGSFEEVDKLEDLASKAHVVFSCADADNLEATKAILRGLRKRHATIGDLPILIHTSGTGVLADDAKGMHTTDTIYDDSNADQMNSLPPTALHRNVDLEVINADKDGYLHSYVILPSTIYGIAKNKLVDAGVMNPHSIQIPIIIKASLDRKQAGVVGKGVAYWPDVHIDDVADLYIVLFDAITTNPEKVGHGYDGYYFGENGEHTWLDISQAIGQALVELGISKSPVPTTFTKEELIKYFGSEEDGNYSGTNSRARANHSRSIGWKPKYTTKDMIASIKPEVEAIIRQQEGKA
ncbi:NAD-P-binding protein [Panus rudis PR-1116 ss-1]|nr:NAD-P-binding protein [Panus rudis PR-1116 ss-1]KAI0071111.1 NAD-P-binding protein [Panus rudis PR-1116 ss-1]